MVLYLRIVHSFDYYSCVEYPSEDEMPHRCGIMHGRGPPPINRVVQADSQYKYHITHCVLISLAIFTLIILANS